MLKFGIGMGNDAQRISAVINTYNAERHLALVLRNLGGFDEIVVCDMQSEDSTLDIAREFGCKIVTFPCGDMPMCEPARNFAIQAASYPWVLVVDADEVVTPELRDYLYSRISDADCPDALNLPMINRYLGEFSKGSPDYHIRFFRRDVVYWPPTIHSIPQINGRVERVSSHLKNVHFLHLADSNLSQSVNKMNRYTDNELFRRANKNWGIGALLYRPIWFFFRSYVIKRGFRDGKRGFIRASMQGYYQFVLVAKLIESRWRDGKDDG